MNATTNLSSYLKHCITRWYDNAKIDYDVNGYFVSAETCESCPLYKACCGFENEMRFEAGLANALAAYDAQR